jgi:viroplasmin and RNaseH domain-containing protein
MPYSECSTQWQYATFEEANEQTLRFSNALQRMFHSMEMALAFMDANSTGPPPAPQLLYAVAQGRNPAVYASHQQAKE